MSSELDAARTVQSLPSREAAEVVIREHYLHRRPPISFAFALRKGSAIVGVVTFGTPPSRHLQMSACPTSPANVIELNRLWVSETEPRNTETWFLARALDLMPPRIVVSYADPVHGHMGYVYRAANFHYAGWTDMDRKTPRLDYLPADPATHTRDAYRNGYVEKRRRVAKVRYWTITGNRTEQRSLAKLVGWPSLDWNTQPPPKASEPQP